MEPRRFLLDGNVYNCLQRQPDVSKQIQTLVDVGHVRILASPVIVEELERSPFGGVPPWFEVDIESEGVAVYGITRYGTSKYGSGQVYRAHLGESNKGRDAVVAESAHSMGAALVSEDHRCRERLRRMNEPAAAMDYSEFRQWIAQAFARSRSESPA